MDNQFIWFTANSFIQTGWAQNIGCWAYDHLKLFYSSLTSCRVGLFLLSTGSYPNRMMMTATPNRASSIILIGLSTDSALRFFMPSYYLFTSCTSSSFLFSTIFRRSSSCLGGALTTVSSCFISVAVFLSVLISLSPGLSVASALFFSGGLL